MNLATIKTDLGDIYEEVSKLFIVKLYGALLKIILVLWEQTLDESIGTQAVYFSKIK